MQKFKVGDKVRKAPHVLSKRFGPKGIYEDVITGINNNGHVHLKDSYWQWVHDLELVEEPKMTHKFKVGDRVVGNSNALTHRVGDTGIIHRLHTKDIGAPDGYWVTFDSDSTTNWIREEEIDLIEEKPAVDTSNPNKKTWSEMTPEEKGALLLAHHEGYTIEFWCDNFWNRISKPNWLRNFSYRVKPNPVVETVELYSVGGDCFTDYRQANDKYKITYQSVDGEPDWSTIKGETL